MSAQFTIDAGNRQEVVFGPYKGRAGVSASGTEVAFFAKLRDFVDLNGALVVPSGKIGADTFVVRSAARHPHDERIVVLSVTAVTN